MEKYQKRKNEEKSWKTLPDEDGSHDDANPRNMKWSNPFLTQYRAAIHSRSLRAQTHHHLLSLQTLLNFSSFLCCPLSPCSFSILSQMENSALILRSSCRSILCIYDEWNQRRMITAQVNERNSARGLKFWGLEIGLLQNAIRYLAISGYMFEIMRLL